jgi:CubicO group peptidase (beta-lactamase class C family)
LESLNEKLVGGAYPNLYSFLVVRQGRLVFEEYFGDRHAAELHSMQSVSKSVASLLVGIAVEQGAIRSLDEPVVELFPEYQLEDVGEWKRSLTLRDLLTMRTGYSWYESPYAGSPLERLNTNTTDWTRFMLEWPMAEPPGERFNYNTGGVVLLASALSKATGIPAAEFAERYLFEPLGIEQHRWIFGPDSLPHMGGGLYLRPRDMARIGQLVLDGGRWDGRQVVASDWIAASMQRVVGDAWAFGERPVDYGYLWWIADGAGSGQGTPEDIYIAAGSRGQWIIIIPEHEMVVVATGWEHGDEWVAPVDLVYSDVIPAVR